MKALKRIAVLLLGAAFVTLALANRQPVSLHAPLFPEIALEIPLYLLIFITMGLGALLCGLMGFGRALKHTRAEYASRKHVKKLEHEVALLKVDKKVKEQVER